MGNRVKSGKPLTASDVAKICKKEGIELKEFMIRDNHDDISNKRQEEKRKRRNRREEIAQKNLEKMIG